MENATLNVLVVFMGLSSMMMVIWDKSDTCLIGPAALVYQCVRERRRDEASSESRLVLLSLMDSKEAKRQNHYRTWIKYFSISYVI